LACKTRSSFHERLPVRRSSSRRATGSATFHEATDVPTSKPTSVARKPTSFTPCPCPCPCPCLRGCSGHMKPFSMHLRAAWDHGATRAVARWPTRAMPTVEALKGDEPRKLASMASRRPAAPPAPPTCTSDLSHSHLWKSCARARHHPEAARQQHRRPNRRDQIATPKGQRPPVRCRR